jgi:small-conductance mechanosensitive channel
MNFVSFLPNLVNLLIIILVTNYGLKLLHFIFREIGRGTVSFENFPADWAEPTYQLVRFIVVALDLVIAFPYLPGSASPAFQGVTIFIGALFSLGSTSVVANIVAGVVLTYTRAFKVGDRVKIAETIGDVLEKSLLVTRVRTIKNVEITIPNSLVLGSHIVNYSSVSQKERGLILNTSVTLGYDLPWREVHKALIKAALITTDVLPEPSPFVLQTSLDDFYVNYEINAYTSKPHNMAVIYSELHQNIQDACNEAGLEILSPHYNSVRDGNTTSIPKEYLPKDYRPPLFNINMRNEDKT